MSTNWWQSCIKHEEQHKFVVNIPTMAQNGQMEASFTSSAHHKANMEDNTLQHGLTRT